MVDIGEFSRTYCVGICAILVPANLLSTLLTLIFMVVKRWRNNLKLSITIAISFAVILSLHVASWWMVGVIKAPTFILLGLATVCMGLNIWAMVSRQVFKGLVEIGVSRDRIVDFR